MLRPHAAALACSTLAACTTLAACSHTTTVGPFEVEAPRGWLLERDDSGTVLAGTKHAEWTYLLLAFTKADIEGDDSPEAVGKEVARELAAPAEDDEVDVQFGSPTMWANSIGMVGLRMGGSMSKDGLTIELDLLLVFSEDDFLVVFGYRSPDATAKHDQAREDLLDSLRRAG